MPASSPLAGALGVAAIASGASPVPVPVVEVWDTADVRDVISSVPVPVSVLVPELNDMIVA